MEILKKSSDLGKIIKRTFSGEEIYYCPWCLEVRGKPDRDGKLYFNPKKGMGKCFKCGTVCIDDSSPSIDRVYQRYYEKEDARLTSIFTLKEWTQPVDEVNEVFEYYASRLLSSLAIRDLSIRACTKPYPGLVFPNNIINGDRTDFFQIRNISKDALIRYTSPSGVKPLYGTSTIKTDTTRAVICEGVISTLSFYGINSLATLALMGKECSPLQLKTLRMLPIQEWFLCLDGGEIKSILSRVDQLQSVGIHPRVVILPFGQDPNNLLCQLGLTALQMLLSKSSTLPLNRLALTLIKSELSSVLGRNAKVNQFDWSEFVKICRKFF